MSNFLGRNFRIMTFGESHGPALGVVIDGLPAGVRLSPRAIQKDLNRCRPIRSIFSSQRQEADEAEVLSGLTADKHTNGAPLAIMIRNKDVNGDISGSEKFRSSHSDWSYQVKYGLKPQPGGGRYGGRETIARVAAGAVAREILSPLGLMAQAYTVGIGEIKAENLDPDFAEKDPLRFADRALARQAHQEVEKAMSEGDSLGSVLEIQVSGVPAGWGEPVFDKLDARLGGSFFSIGGVKAVEFGEGLALARQKDSQANDPLGPDGPLSNRHGGVMGGLSTGLPIVARLFVKPPPSVALEQRNLNISERQTNTFNSGGHDPCLAPGLVPVAEAMALICLADLYLEPNRKSS